MKATEALGLSALVALCIAPAALAGPTHIPLWYAEDAAKTICRYLNRGYSVKEAVAKAYKRYNTLPRAMGVSSQKLARLTTKYCPRTVSPTQTTTTTKGEALGNESD